MQTVTWLQRLTRLSTCLVIAGTSSLLLLLPTTVFTQQRFIVVEKLEDGTLTYRNYELKESRQVDLSDLVLSERLQRKDMRLPPPLDSMWQDIPDFKVILLESGLAKLRNSETADRRYQEAQEKAREQGAGLWATPTPTPKPKRSPDQIASPSPLAASSSPTSQQDAPSVASVVFQRILEFAKFLWGWIVTLSPLGAGGLGITGLIYFFYIRRRVRLLIIGQMSAGKTAVFSRLLDPHISADKILALEASKVKQKVKFRQHIQYAKFEIYPRLTDVPGSAFSTAWDELTRFRLVRRHALVLVLAPTMKNVRSNGPVFDQKYLAVQLGYVQSFMEGGLGARKTRKPKVVILYLNKFDLVSDFPSGDSAAKAAEDKFLDQFREHKQSVELATKRAKIKLHVVIGSALKGWNSDNLITLVGKSLYGNR